MIVEDFTRFDVLTNIGRLYRGTIAEHPKVKTFQAQTIELNTEEEVLIDPDGQLVVRLQPRFQILLKKIPVIF